MYETFRTRQEPLFLETLEEAMVAAASRCGGKKKFAVVLRPDLAEDPEAALRWFLDAANPERRAAFHAVHLRRACEEAANQDCHLLKHWFDDVTGYERTMPAPAKTREQEIAHEMRALTDRFSKLAEEAAALHTSTDAG